MPNSQKAYHTNLATEFYVLSVLHRLGIDATITLGNRKGVDIVVPKGRGNAVTVEAKGANGTTGWWVNNVDSRESGHYIVFVSYKNKIQDVTAQPECWVVPSEELDKFIRPNPKNRIVGRERLRNCGTEYENAWHLLDG